MHHQLVKRSIRVVKVSICYIDSDAIEISLSRFVPLALKAFSACLPVQAVFEKHEIACHNAIS